MKLSTLIENTDCIVLSGDSSAEVTGLAEDSRKLKSGDAFFCISGANFDGLDYAEEALRKGASAVFLERLPEGLNPKDFNAAIVKTDNVRKTLGQIASNFYGHPSDDLTIIGVTGTKGKTTVVSMVSHVLESLGFKCGTIGTLGIRFNGASIKLSNTTPSPLILHKAFRDMVDAGCSYVALEASSQGLMQDRLSGITFDVGAILNIDQDHIGVNEHRNFQEYLDSKKKIFSQSKVMVANRDDKIWNLLDQSQRDRSVTFSLSPDGDYHADHLRFFREPARFGTCFELMGKRHGSFELSVPGEFNIANALAALAILDQLGIDLDDAGEPLAQFQTEGRTQLLRSALKHNRTVFVDYAHNRISFENLLKGLRHYNPHRLIAMFGLRWKDTKIRRYDVGLAAGLYSDFAILTSDYKGPETFREISVDVLKGLSESGGNFAVIEDRREAINHAIQISDQDDIVILIGMGNEKVQNIDGVDVFFSEEEIVNNYLAQLNKSASTD